MVTLNIILVIAILGYFGVETTTFAALFAAAGVAVGLWRFSILVLRLWYSWCVPIVTRITTGRFTLTPIRLFASHSAQRDFQFRNSTWRFATKQGMA